jgi:iron(III) transport system ATP-binding protein
MKDAQRTILSLRGVTRRYNKTTAVAAADFDLFEGRIACLLGPSGCGKSTLLRMIAGLEPVDGGEIHIAGALVSSPERAVSPEDRGVGLVFQENALFPHLNVRDNIGFGIRTLPSAARAAKVDRLLDQFHISHLAASWPHMLSGGEQQRVAIARSLAREPALLLLDEPFSGLDGVLREGVRDALLEDLRRLKTCVLIVTHDPQEAMLIADDLLLMAGGRILQSASPRECYLRPVNVIAARLLGDIVLFPGTVGGGRIDTALGAAPAAGFPDGPAQLALRPDSLFLAAEGAAATVTDVRFAGGSFRIDLALQGAAFSMRATGEPPVRGQTVHVGFDAAAAMIFSGRQT